jgi:dihydrofolate reductase
MSHSKISMIFAMDRNRLIGKDNGLPWRIPADMAYFRRVTTGHSVLMGRKTFESFGSKPLKDRDNIIITRDRTFTAADCAVAHSKDEAIQNFPDKEEVFIIGGSEIYKLFLPDADLLYITYIDEEFEGDAYFPEFDLSEWQEISSEQGIKDEKNPYDYYYRVYQRVK